MVGQVEPVGVVSTISRFENPNNKGNFSATGCMMLKEKSVILNKASRVSKG